MAEALLSERLRRQEHFDSIQNLSPREDRELLYMKRCAMSCTRRLLHRETMGGRGAGCRWRMVDFGLFRDAEVAGAYDVR